VRIGAVAVGGGACGPGIGGGRIRAIEYAGFCAGRRRPHRRGTRGAPGAIGEGHAAPLEGLESFASVWLTQHRQDCAKRLSGEKTRRQKLYKQFIADAPKLYAAALVHDQAEVSALVSVYALISRIRVVSSSAVIEKAEAVVHLIRHARRYRVSPAS
jgi:hypothetical protein